MPDEEATEPSELASDLTLVGALAAITAFHVVDHRLVPARWHVVTHPVAGLAAIGLARAAGLSWDELGLAVGDLAEGARVGAVHGLGTLAIVGVGPLLPTAASLLDDPRLHAAADGSLTFAALVEIPLATALYEELVFRGALRGLLVKRLGRPVGAAVTAALFGLWHVLPAIEDRRHNPVAGRHHPLKTFLPTVVGTTVAGLWFGWLRERSGSVVAPMLVHAASNSGGLASATLVTRWRRRRPAPPAATAAVP